MKQKIIIIGGPTAIGKTELGIKIAQKYNGEIVNADSVQVYRELNIGSAKPNSDEQNAVKHHLIDILEPTSSYSVADYKKDADLVIKELVMEKKLPIIVGGTGFFIKTLLFPMEMNGSFKSEKLREKYEKLRQEFGNEWLFNKLVEIDPKSAEKLHFNDFKRVIRALEIFELSGKKKSEIKVASESEYDYLLLFLNGDRKTLYDRINLRVEKMFEAGLLEEVENLVKKHNLTKNSQSMQAIGYKEFFDYFDGKISLDDVKNKIKLNSRHYAKRQITWFKQMPNIVEINPNSQTEIFEIINNFLTSK